MQIEELRVFYFRSVRSQQTVPLRDGAVLVGPNNVGKTNLLRAIELFFRTANETVYDISQDRPFQERGRTSLRALFRFDIADTPDNDLWNTYVQLHEFVGETPPQEHVVPIYLEFFRAGTPAYKLFPTRKPERARQSEFSKRQQAFVRAALSRFSVRYVPSAKNWDAFYTTFLVPALGEVIESEIREQLDGVRAALREVGTQIEGALRGTITDSLGIELMLPARLSEMLGSVEIRLRDPTPTDLSGKGQGIQSAFLIAAIGWISQADRRSGTVPIWLLEEPEAYMHPSLATAVVRLVDTAQGHGPVVYTTHSLGLIPTDVSNVRGVEKAPGTATTVRTYATHSQATRSVRQALGVKAADYFGYGSGAVLVEGESDHDLLRWYLGINGNQEEHRWLRMMPIDEFGGVKNLSGFLVGTLGVLRNEVPIVALFDGDDAGVKEVRALGSRFSNARVPWEPNRDYVLLPRHKSIEGLFSDALILDLYTEHPTWFVEPPSVDLDGVLAGFRLRDGSKQQARSWLKRHAENDPQGTGRICTRSRSVGPGDPGTPGASGIGRVGR